MEVFSPSPYPLDQTIKELKSGHSIKTFAKEDRSKYLAQWRGHLREPVRIQPGGIVVPDAFTSLHDSIWNFKFRPSDVVVVTYPKCGTTWMQELVWTMKHNPDLDNAMANLPINIRSPNLEFDAFQRRDTGEPVKQEDSFFISLFASVIRNIFLTFPIAAKLHLYIMKLLPSLISYNIRFAMKYCPSMLNFTPSQVSGADSTDVNFLINYIFQSQYQGLNPVPGLMLRTCEGLGDPRVIKTHLPFSLLPCEVLEKSKVIFVLRNPKDMLVSYYHHCRLFQLQIYKGTFQQFVETFIKGDMIYGNYALHVREAAERKDHPNMLIVRYEDMKENPIRETRRIDAFLGTGLSDEQIEKVTKYTSFPEMKKRDNFAGPSNGTNGMFNQEVAKTEGGFFRKGEVGDWQEKISPELSARLDEWIKNNLDNCGFEFRYTA